MEARRRTIVIYEARNGHAYFSEWAERLADNAGVIMNRLEHVEDGSFGDCRAIGEGVHELRIDYGPGYRVYFGQHDDIVVLLCGGNKSTQRKDIQKAKRLWREYQSETEE